MSNTINLEIIDSNEYIGDSLPKINGNFTTLSGTAFDILEALTVLDTHVNNLASDVVALSSAVVSLQEFVANN